jgi:hypothetical protein
MSIGVLARKSTEWTRIYHCDQASTDLEVLVPEVDSGPGRHIGNSRNRELMRDFWAMVLVVANTDMSGVVVGGMAKEVGAQVLFFLRSSSRLSTKFFGKSRPLIHYPVFIPKKEENIEDYHV